MLTYGKPIERGREVLDNLHRCSTCCNLAKITYCTERDDGDVITQIGLRAGGDLNLNILGKSFGHIWIDRYTVLFRIISALCKFETTLYYYTL